MYSTLDSLYEHVWTFELIEVFMTRVTGQLAHHDFASNVAVRRPTTLMIFGSVFKTAQTRYYREQRNLNEKID